MSSTFVADGEAAANAWKSSEALRMLTVSRALETCACVRACVRAGGQTGVRACTGRHTRPHRRRLATAGPRSRLIATCVSGRMPSWPSLPIAPRTRTSQRALQGCPMYKQAGRSTQQTAVLLSRQLVPGRRPPALGLSCVLRSSRLASARAPRLVSDSCCCCRRHFRPRAFREQANEEMQAPTACCLLPVLVCPGLCFTVASVSLQIVTCHD